jgi:UTP-glucose-1-phosphate uridylyltransferase
VSPFYIYQEDKLPLIAQYLDLTKGENPEASGNFVSCLIKHKDVFTYEFSGKRYDIGTLENM